MVVLRFGEVKNHDPISPVAMTESMPSSTTNALSAAIAKMVARIEATDVEQDQVMFAGNWHDAVPRLLVHDPALLPLDLAVWMVLKAYCLPSAPAAFVGGLYGTLTQHTKCNRATVASSLTRMRLLRWVSVCATVRRQNQYCGQVYALHDQPISLADACRLDPNYMPFVQGTLTHRDAGIVEIARAVLATIDDNIVAGIETFESDSVERMSQRLDAFSPPPAAQETESASKTEPFFAVNRTFRATGTDTDIPPSLNSELGENIISMPEIEVAHRGPLFHSTDREIITPSSEFKLGGISSQNENNSVAHRGPPPEIPEIDQNSPHYVKHSPSSSCSSYLNKTTTTPVTEKTLTRVRARSDDEPRESETGVATPSLVLPEDLDVNERNLALRYLNKVSQEHRQPLLDELAGRIKSGRARGDPVRNPISYLNRLITLCLEGKLYQSSFAARVSRERWQVKQSVSHAKPAEVAARPLDRTQLERRLDVVKKAARKSTKP